MRLVTYNVNSISTRLERLLALLAEHRPDVVLLQETKVLTERFPHRAIDDAGYHAVDHSAGRWNGVAILAAHEWDVTDPTFGLAGEPNADDARWVEATVGDVRFVSVYVPNGRAPDTEPFREKLSFFEAMQRRAGALAGRPAIIAGDMNVCPTDLDVWDTDQVHGGTHITADERSRFDRIVDAGYVDAFRSCHPDEPGFTWWDYRAGHFHKGYGLRIDIVLVDSQLSIEGAAVDRAYRKPTKVPGTKPSDHAPVIVDLGARPPNPAQRSPASRAASSTSRASSSTSPSSSSRRSSSTSSATSQRS